MQTITLAGSCGWLPIPVICKWIWLFKHKQDLRALLLQASIQKQTSFWVFKIRLSNFGWAKSSKKLKLCGGWFFIFTSTMKIHFETLCNINRNIDWTKAFMRKVTPVNGVKHYCKSSTMAPLAKEEFALKS